MAEIRKGSTTKPASAETLKNLFASQDHLDGVLYIGYPVFYVAGESVSIDALWVSPTKGIVVFDLVEGPDLTDRTDIRDGLYGKIESQLVIVPELKERRNLTVPIEVFTFAPASAVIADVDTFNNSQSLFTKIDRLKEWNSVGRYSHLLAQIQSTLKLRSSKKRDYVQKRDSKGAIIKDFEATIANLDQQQEKAVIESVEGIQRIRGLAGSGKTVILALKAAYFHAKHPEWDIAVAFHTRSLKQQFVSLIRRFCIEKKGEEPNWEKIRVLNAWGSPSSPGVYSEACRIHGASYKTFGEVKHTADPFATVNTQLLSEIKDKIYEVFDVVLVDEAQDLPIPFLQLCYLMLRAPKRLVYAYDELQKLNEGAALPSPTEIFGADAEDVILRCCYRNPRPLLVTAHAAGFGIYREKGMVQFFNQPKLWADVGYEIESGELKAGKEVTLFRPEDTSPGFYEARVNYHGLVTVEDFSTEEEQNHWVVQNILKNVQEDELLPSDILVISPDALATKSATNSIRSSLLLAGVNNHIAGEANADIFTKDDSVAFSGIYRAKGNEASMVYIINAQHCFESADGSPGNLIKKRNTLFTAITRSKAWVNICGVGSRMNSLKKELSKVSVNNYKLVIDLYPTDAEIERMNVIHREISRESKTKIDESKKFLEWVQEVKESIENGRTYLEDYPKEVVEIIQKLYD